MGAVGVKEGPADIHNNPAPPAHHQARFFRHHCHGHCFQVLLSGIGQEPVHIRRVNHNRHPFLGLGNGDFRSIQTRVFLRHLVKINLKPGSQFPDGNRHAACSKVIALLYEAAHLRAAEHPLDFALRGGISLLHLCAAHFNGRRGVDLGGTGGPADAVAARASAQKDDDITRVGSLTDYIFSGGSAHNRADFHPLRHITRMIHLFYISGGKANLVAIGGISLGSAVYDFPLGQFAL